MRVGEPVGVQLLGADGPGGDLVLARLAAGLLEAPAVVNSCTELRVHSFKGGLFQQQAFQVGNRGYDSVRQVGSTLRGNLDSVVDQHVVAKQVARAARLRLGNAKGVQRCRCCVLPFKSCKLQQQTAFVASLGSFGSLCGPEEDLTEFCRMGNDRVDPRTQLLGLVQFAFQNGVFFEEVIEVESAASGMLDAMDLLARGEDSSLFVLGETGLGAFDAAGPLCAANVFGASQVGHLCSCLTHTE